MLCLKCGFNNPGSFAFCGRCGTPTIAGNAPRESDQSYPSRAERRQLTVMFCDLVGSTALSGQLDPEELSDVTGEYQRVCAEIIDQYEGRIAQFQGDGLIVYFGYPFSHEDDAQRAVRAALGIVAAIPRVRERLAKPLYVRVAIHTGLVVVGQLGGRDNPDPMAIAGETPNIAARLQTIAAPDSVVISSTTHRLVEGFFHCQSLGAPALKGVASPIEAYSVREESGIQTRFEKAVVTGLTALVGREKELERLLREWEESTRGHGRVVMLSGEPGIGKSRLLRVLKERTGREWINEIKGRCSPYSRNSALYPAIDFLQNSLQFQRGDDAQRKLELLEQKLEEWEFPLPDSVPLFATLLSLPSSERYPALPMSPQRQKQKTFEAIVAFLLRAAERGPTRVIVEDLHWADPSTLELLELIIEQVPRTRLFVALAFRPEFAPPWAAQPHITTITLGRLSRGDTEVMIRAVAGGKLLPAEVVNEIANKTEGVPLFVEELTRMLLESGLLSAHNGLYELVSKLPALAIPSTLSDSLMARLDRLGTAKEVAQLAAAIGREFSYELLRAISPLEETKLTGALNRLVDADLLEEYLSPPRLGYRFKHALIRDAAYDSLLRSQRRQYHGKIAEVLPERFGDIVEAQPELLASHCTEAGLTEDAIPHWQRAGQKALERSANREAIGHLTKGLELISLLPETPERVQQELQIRVTLGAALMITKGFASPEAQSVYTRAGKLAQQVGEGSLVFASFWALWVFHQACGEHRKAREAAAECLRLAEAAAAPALLLEAHHALGVSLLLLGEFGQGLQHLEQGTALYDARQHAALANVYGQDSGVACLSYQGWALWFLGYPDKARKLTSEALALADMLSHPVSTAAAANIASWVYQFLREREAARAQAEMAVALSTEREFELWRAMGMIGEGWAMVEQGLLGDGIAQLRAGLSAVRSTGAEVLMPYFLSLLAQACASAGQVADGLSILDEAQVALDGGGERWWQAELHRLKGEFLLRLPALPRENQAQAEEYFLRAHAIARDQHAKSLELRASMSLSRLWRGQGKNSEAREILAETYEWFTEGFDTAELQDAQKLLQELSND
jgi:class 3 adenylate cyclase/predicted ATPase